MRHVLKIEHRILIQKLPALEWSRWHIESETEFIRRPYQNTIPHSPKPLPAAMWQQYWRYHRGASDSPL
jgi:hypothetical protein